MLVRGEEERMAGGPSAQPASSSRPALRESQSGSTGGYQAQAGLGGGREVEY